MYSIEYYKRGKKEPDWVREEKSVDDFESKQDYKEYVRNIKKFYACRKIKSLTIDIEDLILLFKTFNAYCVYSCDGYDLGVLCACAQALSAKRVTIYNDGYDRNLEIIYNIINTKWLINKDEFEYINKYTEEAAIKEIVGKMHDILTKIDASEGPWQTPWGLQLSDYLQQIRHYCYESEKINRGEIDEVQKKPKKIGQKQYDWFFEHYDY